MEQEYKLEVTLLITKLTIFDDEDDLSSGDIYVTTYARMHGHTPNVHTSGEHDISSGDSKIVRHEVYRHDISHPPRNFDIWVYVYDEDSLSKEDEEFIDDLSELTKGILKALGKKTVAGAVGLITPLIKRALDGDPDEIGSYQEGNMGPPALNDTEGNNVNGVPPPNDSDDVRWTVSLKKGDEIQANVEFQLTVANIGNEDGAVDVKFDVDEPMADLHIIDVGQVSDRRVELEMSVLGSLETIPDELVGSVQYDLLLETDNDPGTGARDGRFAGADYSVRIRAVGPASWEGELVKLHPDGSENILGPVEYLYVQDNFIDVQDTFIGVQVNTESLGNPLWVAYWARSEVGGVIDMAPDGGASDPIGIPIRYDGTVSPKVLRLEPQDGAEGVPASTIGVTFSEPMNRAATEEAFSMNPPVLGTFTWESGEGEVGRITKMIFTPAHELGYNTRYTVTLAGTATDEGGNLLDGNLDGTGGDDIVWSFITAPSFSSADASGIAKNCFRIDEDVFVGGTGFPPDSLVNVYVVVEGFWGENEPIGDDVGDGMDTISVDSEGTIAPTIIWGSPLKEGEFDIVIDTDGDNLFELGVDAVDTNPVGFRVEAVSERETLEVGEDKPYATIQAAIDAASPGDIVLVSLGTYDGFRVGNIDNLSVIAPEGAEVKGAPGFTFVYDEIYMENIMIYVENSDNTLIENFTVDGSETPSDNIGGIAYFNSSGRISGGAVKNIIGTHYGVGIEVYENVEGESVGTVEISGVTVENVSFGILVDNNCDVSIISCEIDGSAIENLGYGILIMDNSKARVEDSWIGNWRGEGYWDGQDTYSVAILIGGQSGDRSGAEILRCKIENNKVGIFVGYDGCAEIHYNRIIGNEMIGAVYAGENESAVVAQFNYWGTTSYDDVGGMVLGMIEYRPICDSGMSPVRYPWFVAGGDVVGLTDLMIVAYHYGEAESHPNWLPAADVDGDGRVGLTDLMIVAYHYGESWEY